MRIDVRKRDLEIYQLLRSGMSRKEVAFKFNMTIWAVYKSIERHDVDRRRIQRRVIERRNFPKISKNNPLNPPA